jgi:glutaredoxin
VSNRVQFLLLAVCAWGAYRFWQNPGSLEWPVAESYTAEDVRALAATVQAGEIFMYTTTTCPYCAGARQWLTGYGFGFTECRLDADAGCEAGFAADHGTGVPLVIITRAGQRTVLPDGFDSDALLAALRP